MMSWDMAATFCEREGGRLALPLTFDSALYLVDLLTYQYLQQRTQIQYSVFIGIKVRTQYLINRTETHLTWMKII